MVSRFNSVLTEEILAAVEQVCQAARSCGVTVASLYHGESGGSAGIEKAWSAEERKNWLT